MKFLLSLLLAVPLAVPHPVFAGPGAHGPNGEHLDAPAQTVGLGDRPRTETATEGFELVATLNEGELTVFIDRFATNEPLLQAKLTVESGGLKTEARFDATHGHYAASDPTLLELLNRPGEHPLVFTLIAGEESDLLDAILQVEADPHDQAHSHALEYAAIAGTSLLVIGAGVWLWRRRIAQGGL